MFRCSRSPEPTISIVPRVRRPAVDRALCRALLVFLARAAAPSRRRAGAPPWASLTVLLVGDRLSAEVHAAVFNDPAPTDVITLAYDSAPGDPPGLSGELVVNLDRALSEGRRHPSPWSPDHELALYLAHGVDHLTGADDLSPSDRRRMRARDLRWVSAAARAGLVVGLLRKES